MLYDLIECSSVFWLVWAVIGTLHCPVVMQESEYLSVLWLTLRHSLRPQTNVYLNITLPNKSIYISIFSFRL